MAKVALPPEKVVRKIFPADVALKLAPLIMTVLPTLPEAGETEVMTGV